MSDFRIAHRYAKALIELSEEKGRLEEVHADITQFRELYNGSREMQMLLKNPIVKHETKRKIISKIFDGRVDPITSIFFEIVSRKKREKFLPEIAREFHVIYNTYKGIELVKVTTAQPLTAELRKEFEAILRKMSGKKTIELKEVVNEDLIGGYILKVGDRQIDDSVSGKLNTIRKKLIVTV